MPPRRPERSPPSSSPRSCSSLIVVPGFTLLYTLDQKSLLPEEGVD